MKTWLTKLNYDLIKIYNTTECLTFDQVLKVFFSKLRGFYVIPEFSVHNPGALFRKSLSNNIDFLNSTPGVVYGKLLYCHFMIGILQQYTPYNANTIRITATNMVQCKYIIQYTSTQHRTYE